MTTCEKSSRSRHDQFNLMVKVSKKRRRAALKAEVVLFQILLCFDHARSVAVAVARLKSQCFKRNKLKQV